jgi:hypothetical protein
MEARVVEHEDWIETEFGAADLGDARRTQRLLTLMGQVGARPGASLPEACGSRGQLKAAYRFWAKDAIAPEDLWASHIVATYERAAAVPVVLAVQDTTELDWGPQSATAGLGPLGAPSHQGLLVHTTVAFTPERVPLGIVAQGVWARDPWTVGQRVTRKQRPIAEKESSKGLASLQAVNEARQACPQTAWVSVGDREADVYDLLVAERPAGVELLIRAAWDRRVEHPEQYLWATVLAWPVAATLTVQVPRHEGQPARQAVVSLRFGPVTLRPPRHRQAEHLPAVTLWAVAVVEEDPPAGVEPLAWLLLSTGEVATVAGAIERVEWYGVRFGIEVWHKVLKSGCRIEARQLETSERLQRGLPLYSILAWHILYATLLSRALPELPCTVLLALEEWQALYCTIHHMPRPPTTPPTLQQAVRWIARLGGFLERPSDGEPGVTVLWKGFQHLADLTTMYCIMCPPSPKSQKCGAR